jgi:hypothetical protein
VHGKGDLAHVVAFLLVDDGHRSPNAGGDRAAAQR